MANVHMNSIQEVFSGNFQGANNLLIQKCQPDEHNIRARQENFSESWPTVQDSFDLFGIALETGHKKREILVGTLKDIIPSNNYPGRFRFHVDKFHRIGVHDRATVSDADFYGNGGGGGSRVIVQNLSNPSHIQSIDNAPGGAMEQRLQWVRKNHKKFRDNVWSHWNGKCAVYQTECNGLLIASHIYPWSLSNSQQKTDFHNGLLLSAPLDYLFDRGYISFSDIGNILINPKMDAETLAIFGIAKSKILEIDNKKITQPMKMYLRLHRLYFEFQK